MRKKRNALLMLTRRYAGGGTAEPATEPEKQEPGEEAKAQEPAKQEPAKEPTKEPAAAITTEQLESARQQAIEDYKKHLEEAKDFEKMTAEEKVVYLQKQMSDEKLAGYTTKQLSAAGLPVEFVPFVKGSDEKDTDERIKTLKAAYDKGVQVGVDQRFKANGYVPKGTAAGELGDEGKKRPRGVSVK
nr:DUF4355 domain-containing protein [uncultured Caproiciproducens sp.]